MLCYCVFVNSRSFFLVQIEQKPNNTLQHVELTTPTMFLVDEYWLPVFQREQDIKNSEIIVLNETQRVLFWYNYNFIGCKVNVNVSFKISTRLQS